MHEELATRSELTGVRMVEGVLSEADLDYGHGGAGVTVAWGCAEEAAAPAASS